MVTDRHLSINVWLAGRSYRIKVLPEEEEVVRRAIKEADESFDQLKREYVGKDIQDFLAMSLLMYAANHATQQMADPSLTKEIDKLGKSIDKFLEKNKE